MKNLNEFTHTEILGLYTLAVMYMSLDNTENTIKIDINENTTEKLHKLLCND